MLFESLVSLLLWGAVAAEPKAPAEPLQTQAVSDEPQTSAHKQADAQESARSRVITDLSRPVKLVEFSGGEKVLKRAFRLRITRPTLNYTLDVAADGTPTGCKVIDRFRSKFTAVDLCRELMRDHHTFEPARNAAGEPVASRFTHQLDYAELRAAIED